MANRLRAAEPALHDRACRSQALPAVEQAHASWDLDIGDLRSWLRAQRACLEECPLLAACAQLRSDHFPGGNPQAVIWAGVAYSETGRVLDTTGLRRLAAVRRNHDRRRQAVASSAGQPARIA